MKLLKNILTVLFSVFIIVYFVLQLRLTASDTVEVEYAFYAVVNDVINAQAYLFRAETVIPQSGAGARSYLVKNGEKVKINQELCATYQNTGDAGLQDRVNEIDRQISILEKSNITNSVFSTDLSRINNGISGYMMQIQRSVAAGDLESALRAEDPLLVQMNRRQATRADSKDFFGSRISALKREKAELKAGLNGPNTKDSAPCAGYFYIENDGYENIFSEEALVNLSVEGFKGLKEARPDVSVQNGSVGKIALTSKWYIAFSALRRDAVCFKEGGKYKAVFPFSSDIEISLSFERYVSESDTDETVLIFSTHTLAEGFNFARRQDVQVIKKSVEGLKIRKASLRNENNVPGVYSLQGSKVVYKTVEVLEESKGFYMVALPDKNNRAYSHQTKLSLNDAVLIGGKNLYVGKVLQ